MISLILTLVILIIFVVLTIFGINSLLRNVVDKFLNKSENFENFDYNNTKPNLDACKELDSQSNMSLNSQTGTNIPLNPIQYNNHVGKLNIYRNKENNELKQGKLCAAQNELLYDGVWKSETNNMKNGFLNQHWQLTNGNIINDYVCSDKFIQTNKTLPEDYIDCTSTPKLKELDTGIYFNDKKDDPLDLQIACFPEIFNKGMV